VTVGFATEQAAGVVLRAVTPHPRRWSPKTCASARKDDSEDPGIGR